MVHGSRNNFISWKLSRRPFRFTVARRVYQFRGKSPPSCYRPKAPTHHAGTTLSATLDWKTIAYVHEIQSSPPPTHLIKLPLLLSFSLSGDSTRGLLRQNIIAVEILTIPPCGPVCLQTGKLRHSKNLRQDLNLRYKLVEWWHLRLKITGRNWS